ncbi:MAG: hypothetical protein ACE5EN_10800 [Nitrospinota bacterium]
MTGYGRFNIHLALTACMIVLFILILPGCTTPQLEKAFTPNMDSSESQEVISEYCISCHVHKDFKVEAHLKKARTLYTKPEYSNTAECRVCHTYTKTWLLDVRRGTHWPARK